MVITRTTLAILLLAVGTTSQAICPIGDMLNEQRASTPDSPSQAQGPVPYRLAGQTENGTMVLHAVGDQGAFSERHEVLTVRPVSSPDRGAGLYPITIGGEDYVIERLTTLAVDQPCGGWVSVEGDNIVVTIAAP